MLPAMNSKPLVVVTDFITEPLDRERQILGDIANITALNAFSEDDLEGRIEDADAIMLYHFISITRKTIERLRRCKLIVRCGVGFDNVDHAAARERNIAVANVPDYGTEDVADTAIGMALSLARGIHFLNSRLRRRQGPWVYTQIQPTHRLRGQVFGIVGMGRIGTAAALRAKSLGMEVAYYDPYAPQGRDKSLGIRHVEKLDDLLEQAAILSLHCPLTAETRHLINGDSVLKMRPGAFLINTARGAVVDVHAVLAAIERNQLAGAAIDVLEQEPPNDADPFIEAWRDPNHPAHDRILVNPHSAFYSEEGLLDMRIKGCQNCRRVFTGLPPYNIVN